MNEDEARAILTRTSAIWKEQIAYGSPPRGTRCDGRAPNACLHTARVKRDDRWMCASCAIRFDDKKETPG